MTIYSYFIFFAQKLKRKRRLENFSKRANNLPLKKINFVVNLKMLNGPTGPSRSLDQWSSGRTGLDRGLFFFMAQSDRSQD
jgi:hypothetical protein